MPRRFRFVIYRAATRRGVVWHWNDYPEVVTESGVGVRIGGALQVGYRVFSLVWKRLPLQTPPPLAVNAAALAITDPEGGDTE